MSQSFKSVFTFCAIALGQSSLLVTHPPTCPSSFIQASGVFTKAALHMMTSTSSQFHKGSKLRTRSQASLHASCLQCAARPAFGIRKDCSRKRQCVCHLSFVVNKVRCTIKLSKKREFKSIPRTSKKPKRFNLAGIQTLRSHLWWDKIKLSRPSCLFALCGIIVEVLFETLTDLRHQRQLTQWLQQRMNLPRWDLSGNAH